ncbi:hypothetical protein ES703_108828 [subsurface metagenome]
MNVTHTAIIILDAGILSGTVVQIVAVTPQNAIRNYRRRIMEGKDTAIFRSIGVVNDNSTIGNSRR